MRWQRDGHFMEALYVVFLAFCVVLLSSCSHDPTLDREIKAKAEAQPVMDLSGRTAAAKETIQGASLTEEQKAKLEQISLAATTELKVLREDEAKLRLLLAKQLVDPNVSDREIDGITKRILELNKKSNKRWLSALDDARKVIGRKSEQDARFYRSFMQGPAFSENFDIEKTEK